MDVPVEWVAAGFGACGVAIAFLAKAQSEGHRKCEERQERSDKWIRENLVGLISSTNETIQAFARQQRELRHSVRDLSPSDQDSESDLHHALKSPSGKVTLQVLERNEQGETTSIIRRHK